MIARSRQQGLTLMELMIVVGIIAIIAMVAYPSLSGYLQKGYDTEAIEEISSLEVVLANYLIENGTYVNAGDTAAIETNYNWEPATQTPSFDYEVDANSNCPAGINVCYTITATGKADTTVEDRTIVKTSWGSLTVAGTKLR
ncbi:MAG: prepilin-type N-terminal cleavage/methylation domain-containing protein [Gammaproteobacteria bacterium]|nr:prepilin-type N-terminal cleavage/methylation domain-containing protein [Gammaproteobacteria bacterium]